MADPRARARWLEALAIFEQLRAPEADQIRDLLAEPPILEGSSSSPQ